MDTLGAWLVAISGTSTGAYLATVLALVSAFAHAVFGALQKGRFDPWMARGAIDAWLAVLSAPIALLLVPWPSGVTWLILLGAMGIHFVYKLSMALAYERAAFTVVYPIVRGTGPLLTVVAVSILFAERYTALQWAGVATLSGGILLLALRNISEEKIDVRVLKIGLAWALFGGVTVAVYTTYDAWGIRQSPNPMTFLAWFFFLTALDMPLVAAWRYRKRPSVIDWRGLARLGFAGAIIAWISFGGVMVATRLDTVGEAAVLRETSIVFAAVIGWLFLGEKVGPRRALLMILIVLGAILVEVGG